MTRAESQGRLDLDRPTFDAVIAHARSDVPYEVCGLLAFADGQVARHYRIPNTERSMTSYRMAAKPLLHAMREIEDADWALGIYHSHTHTEAFPSRTDVELAAYPDAVYLIVSLQELEAPVVRAFEIVEGRITERTVYIDGSLAPTGSR